MEALGVIGILIFILVIGPLVGGLIVYWLANAIFSPALLSAVFGEPTVGYWSCVGLVLICNLLFKNYTPNNNSKDD